MNRKDLLVAGGVAVAITLGWYQFVWQSQGTAAADANRDKAGAQEQVTKLKTQVASLQRTKKELADKAEQVAQIEQAIPEDPSVSSLIKLLQTKAAEHQLTITTLTNGKIVAALSVDPKTPPAGPSEIPLSITAFGAYTDVVSFIEDLGHLSRLLVVDTMSLTPADSSANPGEATTRNDISATIVLRAFTTAEPADATASVGATTTTTAAAAPSASSGSTTASTAATAVP